MMKIFTDGGCINNGKPGAKAAFGVRFESLKMQLVGLVQPTNYALRIDDQYIIEPSIIKIAPTNQRAEMLAIIYAIVISLNKGNTNIEVVTDSKFCIQLCTQWLPFWSEEMRKKKQNTDLTEILKKILPLVKIQFTHQSSHTYRTGAENSPNVIGNHLVDVLVSNHIKTATDYLVAFACF